MAHILTCTMQNFVTNILHVFNYDGSHSHLYSAKVCDQHFACFCLRTAPILTRSRIIHCGGTFVHRLRLRMDLHQFTSQFVNSQATAL